MARRYTQSRGMSVMVALCLVLAATHVYLLSLASCPDNERSSTISNALTREIAARKKNERKWNEHERDTKRKANEIDPPDK